jgi:hypothetical protein
LQTYALAGLFDAQGGPTAEFAAFFRERRIRDAVVADGRYLLGDQLGGVSCWAANGTRVWQRDLGDARITALASSGNGADMLLVVATRAGAVVRMNPATGATVGEPIYLGGSITALQLAAPGGVELAFALVETDHRHATYYAVRLWDLARAQELDTCIPDDTEAGVPFHRRALEFDTDEPRHAFVMGGYYKTKPTPCGLAYRRADHWLVMCGGAYGEVRALDFATFEEVDCWVNPSSLGRTGYVNRLAAADCDGVTLVLAGADHGGLWLRQLAAGPSAPGADIAVNDEAHGAAIHALAAFPRSRPLFLSGGQDGVLNAWSAGLVLLERIELGTPIVKLVILDDQRVLVATSTGVMVLRFAHLG